MFKCFDSQDQREIIILDTEWDGDRLALLRNHARSSALLCPECKQPVTVKAGEKKAWHFAHKDLGSCPLQSESAAVLKARSLLYKWLGAKFHEANTAPEMIANVTVEKKVSLDLPRPVDCYVELPNGDKIAYWVFDKGMRDRTALMRGWNGIRLQPVFLTDMLRLVEGQPDTFDLSTTERDFLSVPSSYDKLYSSFGRSLHYLDTDSGLLRTLRGVSLKHAPQRHMSVKVLEHPLPEILTNLNGEFIHPGEHERLQELKRQDEERQAQLIAAKARVTQSAAPQLPKQDRQYPSVPHPLLANKIEEDVVTLRVTKKIPMTCTGCGKDTIDWTSCKPWAGTCLCRECGMKL